MSALAEPVTNDQRYSARDAQPCPVCGGGADDPRGEGIRCIGFVSGSYARCSREQYAKGVPLNQDGETYTHRLDWNCRCGTRHAAPSWWEPLISRFEYVENDDVVGVKVRRDWNVGPKDVWWQKADGTRTLGRSPASLPLYGSDRLSIVPTGSTIVVVEGEKKVEMLLTLGITAVGIGTGAPGTHDLDAFKVLLDYDVILWGDQDDKGQQQRKANGARLLELGHRTVREILDAPAPDDYLNAGNTAEQVLALLGQAVPITPTTTAPTTYRLTDTGNAERFRDRYTDRVRYCPEWRAWVIFDGQRWVEDVGGILVDQLMKACLLAIYDESKRLDGDEGVKLRKYAAQCESAGKRSAALELARSEMPVYARAFDANPWVLNCQNGLLDLKTLQLRPARADEFCTKITQAAYDPAARDPLWEMFLDAKVPDRELRRWLQKLGGYGLIGVRDQDMMGNPHGPTRSGKTTYTGALCAALGDYATEIDANIFMLSRHGHDGETNQPVLATLPGMRLVVSAEASENMRLDVAKVKKITGCDTLTAAAKYKNPVRFKPTFLWLLHGNERVKVTGEDDAIWVRIKQIPFKETTSQELVDESIRTRLLEDPACQAAVLRWMVEGLRLFRTDGSLKPYPKAVEQETDEYRAAMNPLAPFIVETCVLEPNAEVLSSVFRATYTGWCDQQNIQFRDRLGDNDIAKHLTRLGCTPARVRNEKGDRARVWRGIRLIGERP
jgi:P4 family phage/plasmid primase-like protien